MTQRKATDVLLDLEDKIDLALRRLTVLDTNVKILLNKVSPTKNLEEVKSINNNEKSLEVPKEAPKITVESFTQVGDKSTQKVIKSTIDSSAKKRLVHQNLIYNSDNKNVVLAKVKAYDMDQNLVGETKTNMHGKWKLSLRPGKYIIHIVKNGTRTPPRPPIDIKSDIIVKDIDSNEMEDLLIQ